jgi:hypothetical protein
MRLKAVRSLFLSSCVLVAFVANGAIHYVDVNSTNPVPPYISWDTAAVTIQDAENLSNGGDEILVTNGIYRTGGTLDSRVSLSRARYVHSVNGPAVTFIEGYQPGITNGTGSIRCVNLFNGGVFAGFTLTNGAAPGGGGGIRTESICTISNCIIVGNTGNRGGGAYSGTLLDCTLLNNISTTDGGGGYQCVMVNCALSNNIALSGGGGASQGNYLNCVIAKNSAGNGAGVNGGNLVNCLVVNNAAATGSGGGAYSCGLTNCVLIGNSAKNGGGVYQGIGYVVNCTVVNNSAAIGGGIWLTIPASSQVTTISSILYLNSATNGSNFYGLDQLIANCCMPDTGSNNTITNDPRFVDPANGDFHLLPDSLCINAGWNLYITNATDIDGNPRIAGGTVDIGAYEFQNPQSVISYGWLQNHGLPTDGSVDFADSDSDGMNNWQEWVANTNPTNSLSYLHMLSPDPTNNAAGVTFHWQSAGIRYFLQRSTNLAGPFVTFATNFYAAPVTATYRDAAATNAGPYFYRVGVQP